MSNEPRVLIIEDNDVLRVMIFTILRHQAVAVDTADSMKAAREKIAECDYALILIDMNLAERTAYDFLNWFRDERAPDVPTFIIAVRDPNDEAQIDSDVVKAVLQKPLEIDTLAELVRECAPLVPMPEDAKPCPPAESETRKTFDRGSSIAN